MWSRSCSKLGAGRSSGGSKAAAHPTCMWAEAVSTSRNDASRAERRLDAICLSSAMGGRVGLDPHYAESAILLSVSLRVARDGGSFALGAAAEERLGARVEAAVRHVRRAGGAAMAAVTVPIAPELDLSAAVLAARREGDRYACLEQPDRHGFVLAALGQAL